MIRFLEKSLERLWLSCGGSCHSHGGEGGCPLMSDEELRQRMDDPEVRRYSAGGPLVAACLAVFLLPLLTAAGGAYLAGEYLPALVRGPVGLWQLIGTLGGLAAGVGLAKLLLFAARKRQTSFGGGEE